MHTAHFKSNEKHIIIKHLEEKKRKEKRWRGEMHIYQITENRRLNTDEGETNNPFSKERCLFSVAVTKHFKIDLLTFYISRFLPATNAPFSVFNFGFFFAIFF